MDPYEEARLNPSDIVCDGAAYWASWDESASDYATHKRGYWLIYSWEALDPVSCVSADPSVAAVQKVPVGLRSHWNRHVGKYCWDHYWVYPSAPGDTTLKVSNYDGSYAVVPVHVEKSYFDAALGNETGIGRLKYGQLTLEGETFPKASATAYVGGKTFAGKVESDGKFKIKGLPLLKIKSSVRLEFRIKDSVYEKSVKVKSAKSKVAIPKISGSDAAVTVKVTMANKGDFVKLKINGKTSTKRVKSAKRGIAKVRFKLSGAESGKTVSVVHYNKWKQKLGSAKRRVK